MFTFYKQPKQKQAGEIDISSSTIARKVKSEYEEVGLSSSARNIGISSSPMAVPKHILPTDLPSNSVQPAKQARSYLQPDAQVREEISDLTIVSSIANLRVSEPVLLNERSQPVVSSQSPQKSVQSPLKEARFDKIAGMSPPASVTKNRSNGPDNVHVSREDTINMKDTSNDFDDLKRHVQPVTSKDLEDVYQLLR